jgi:hypothetical protein
LRTAAFVVPGINGGTTPLSLSQETQQALLRSIETPQASPDLITSVKGWYDRLLALMEE